MGDVSKNVQNILSLILSDSIEDLLQLLNALSHGFGDFIV